MGAEPALLPARTAPAQRRGARGRAVARRGGRYLLLVVAAIVVVFPIYMTLVGALLTPHQLTSSPPYLFPTDPQWHSFATAASDGHLGLYLRNSAIVTSCITLAQLVTSICGGYAFACVEFPFKRLALGLCLATMMIPAEVTLFPNYRTIALLGWVNTFPALIVPFVASGLGIFLFRQAFRQVPVELREAARLDGYGHLRFLVRVAAPVCRPVIGAFAVFSFLAAWNQYLWPLIVTRTDSVRTVQIGLKQLEGLNFDQANVIVAGTVLAALPILVILIAFQKQLVRGLTAGAVKG
jgi:sn-glycerol 3-phosphate transport system permease protein